MYIGREDLLAAIGKDELTQLTNDEMGDYSTAEPNWDVVDNALRYASELADGYLAGRYALPLESVPTLLGQWCTDIARHWLHKRRLNGAEFPKQVQQAYEDAVKLLSSVRDGKLHLGIRESDKIQPERGAYRVRASRKQNWEAY